MKNPRAIRPVSDWLHVSCQHLGEGHDWSVDDVEAQLDEFARDRQDPPFVGIMANGPCGDVNHLGHAPPARPRRSP